MTSTSQHVVTMAGVLMPRMIYGTAWKKDRTTELVKLALRTGFRGIDTACQPKHYSEPLVGKAIAEILKEGNIKREDIFLQTKFTSINGQDLNQPLPYNPQASLRDQVFQSFATSQKNLQTDYVDSLVLHSPMDTHAKTMEVWTALEEIHNQGKARQLGISNVNFDEFRRIWNECKVKPAVVQNRFYNSTHYDVGLREFLKANNVYYQSFWTLSANPHVLKHAQMAKIAKRVGKDVEQVFYKYMIQHVGACPLNGTTNEKHMKDDLSILSDSFELSTEECNVITGLLQ